MCTGNSSSLKSHAVPASIEPNAQHININPAVFGQRTPSSIEPESHAKNHVTPSSAVLAVLAVLHFLSFLSPTPYNPASQNKNRSLDSTITPVWREQET
jgi:quinol-cytochrome oxidoreductase complex cytochrome b subunit